MSGAGASSALSNTALVSRPGPNFEPADAYGLIGDFVRLVDPHTEADPGAVYGSALVALGNLVGPGPYMQVGAARHPCVTFAIIVGATAKARKGTSWAEVRRFVAMIDDAWSRSCVIGGLGSGEALVSKLAGSKATSGETPADTRALFVEEEWARTLSICRRDGSILGEMLRAVWDGRQLENRTKRESIVVPRHHVSVIAHITAEEFAARGRELDLVNGLMNRFMFVHARRSKLLPSGGELSDHGLEPLAARARSAIDLARTRCRMNRTGVAERLWSEIYFTMAADDPGGLVGAVTSRSDAIVLRLSLLFALFDEADSVDAPHIEAAWRFWQYSRACAAYVLGDAVGDPVADRIAVALSDNSAGLDRTDISELFGRHKTKRELDRALRMLIEAGRITEMPEETGGRPRTVYRANLDPKGSAER